jgi:hypothetical protein
VGIDVAQDLGEGQASASFFEKKKQKTFVTLDQGLEFSHGLTEQKFFGSFFQKRTSF